MDEPSTEITMVILPTTSGHHPCNCGYIMLYPLRSGPKPMDDPHFMPIQIEISRGNVGKAMS